jgi:hypothetical protein
MTDDPMMLVTFEMPFSALREFQAAHRPRRERYANWSNLTRDVPSMIEGRAKLAALDVELPRESPEVGRKIRLSANGGTDREGVVLGVSDNAGTRTWVWVQQEHPSPITYEINSTNGWSWEYVS